MSERFKISVHQNGYYQVSIPNYYGGEVVKAEEYDRVSKMLATIIDAHHGTSFHHIGDGDGIPEADAEEIRQWWKDRLEKIVEDWRNQKGGS